MFKMNNLLFFYLIMQEKANNNSNVSRRLGNYKSYIFLILCFLSYLVNIRHSEPTIKLLCPAETIFMAQNVHQK